MGSFLEVFYIMLVYVALQTLINTRIYPYLMRTIPRHPAVQFAPSGMLECR